jgi:uncharacterized protein with PIN domain
MTGPTAPAQEVARARDELRDSVDAITTVQHKRIERDEGDVQHFTASPLLAQVEQEITEQSSKAGAFTARSKPPVYLDAVQFLSNVDAHVGRFEGATRTLRMRAWLAEKASSNGADVIDAAAVAVWWHDTVLHLLEPRPRFHLRGQRCPECGAVKVHSHKDVGAGENHALPALQIDPANGTCRCQVCRAEWARDNWSLLVQVLEQQKMETLRAQDWNPSVRARDETERRDKHR